MMKHLINKMKRLLTAGLAFVMVLTVLPMVPAQAASTNVTMYVGETSYYRAHGIVSDVTSTKSGVVEAGQSKRHGSSSEVEMVAEKTGKSTVTVKTNNHEEHKGEWDFGGSRDIRTFLELCKKLDMPVKVKQLSPSKITLVVENYANKVFEKVEISYTLKDAEGNVLEEDKKELKAFDMCAKKTSYASIYVGKYRNQIDAASCTAKVTYLESYPVTVYKDVSKKVKATISDEKEQDGTIHYNVNLKNEFNDGVKGVCYIMLYDKDDKLIGVEYQMIVLGKKGTNGAAMKRQSLFLRATYPTYDHMKTVVNANATSRQKK